MTLDLTDGSLDLSGISETERHKYNCENCSYRTNIKCNFKRHSKRHLKIHGTDTPFLTTDVLKSKPASVQDDSDQSTMTQHSQSRRTPQCPFTSAHSQSIRTPYSESTSTPVGPSTSTPHSQSIRMPYSESTSTRMGPSTSTPLKYYLKASTMCDQCGKEFKSKFGLTLHKKNKHEKIFKHVCEICGKGFNQTVQFRFHCANHVHVIFTKCSHCSKTFKGHSSLQRHMRLCPLNSDITKENAVTFPCNECEKVFPTKDRLNYHKKGKHGDRKYMCDKCGKRYAWRSSLKEHKKRCNIMI